MTSRTGKIVAALILLGTVSIAVAGKAKYKVVAEPGFEFDSYATWSWAKGTPAAYPEIQERIVGAIEKQMGARGLTLVEGERSDLRVSSYAFAQMEMDVIGRSFWGAYGGAIRVDVSDYTKGTLWVKIVDPNKEEPVWQGLVGKGIKGRREKVLPKIDGIVETMFSTAPENWK